MCWDPCGVSVAASAVDPPGPIPNPVVTHGSAGEYCGGDSVGGEAVAGTPQGSQHPITSTHRIRRGVEQWQLVGLITQRSQVRILPPLPRRRLPSVRSRRAEPSPGLGASASPPSARLRP